MNNRPLVWLGTEVHTPPFSTEARRHAGFLLREIQDGKRPSMPDSRPMPSIGARVYELRVDDPYSRVTWRIIYRIDLDAIIISHVFAKKTQKTSIPIITVCKRRYQEYDRITKRG